MKKLIGIINFIILFVIVVFFSGCEAFFDPNKEERIAYYSDDNNYIIDEGEIVQVLYHEVDSQFTDFYYTTIKVKLNSTDKYHFGVSWDQTTIVFEIYIKKNAQALSARGWIPKEGDVIMFKTVPDSWGSVLPIVELWANDTCYLDFKEGKSSLIEYTYQSGIF